MKELVTKEDIEYIAKLMRIDIEDTDQYLAQTQKILNYFDKLDEADISSEEIQVHEVPINELREDVHKPFETKLIDKLKSYRGKYVRAPKMN